VAQHHPVPDGLGRCIAPDLIGMGRSDKPELAYRFVDHARYVDSFLRALDLDRITFVLHDWGSALGFDWAMSHEGKVRGLAFMEAILGPMPSWDGFRPEGRETFQALRTPGVGERMVLEENLFVEQILRRVCCAHSPTRRWRTTGRLLPTPRRAGRRWRGRARSPSPVSPPTWSPSASTTARRLPARRCPSSCSRPSPASS